MKVTCSGLLVPELTYADTEVYLVQFLADFGTRKKVGGKGNARYHTEHNRPRPNGKHFAMNCGYTLLRGDW